MCLLGRLDDKLGALAKPFGLCTVCDMSTLTKPKVTARKAAAVKTRRAAVVISAPSKTFAPGYARDVLKIKAGVDLTKPTLAPGKYL